MNDFKKRFENKTKTLFDFLRPKKKIFSKFRKDKSNEELNSEDKEKNRSKTTVTIDALGKTWKVVFRKGVPYLNYFNIFYALPKRITIYFIALGFLIFIGCGIPLSYDFLFSPYDWYLELSFTVKVVIAWTSISGLLLLQAATTGYAYLSKESLVKARIERSNKVMWLRFVAFLLITINVLFTIVTLLSIPYDFSSHALTWTSLSISVGLAILTAWVYKYQKQLLQRQAYIALQEKTQKKLLEKKGNGDTTEQELSPFLYLDEKSVLKRKEYVKKLDKILKRNEKKETEKVTSNLEIGWLERTRVWNWKITKKISKKLEKYDFLPKWSMKIKRKLRKIKNKFGKY